MKLTDREIIQALWEGRKIRRLSWDTGVYLWVSIITGHLHIVAMQEEHNDIDLENISADDLEVIE